MQRILIVEDDKEIAILERDYLEINGFETEIISNGQKALTAILENRFDLVLLDLMLPGCDGYEICRQVRERVDIPILMVTARVESGDKIHGLGLGADDYIAKPFDPAELVARVKAHLSRYARLTGASREGGHEEEILEVGPLKILPRSRKVYKNGWKSSSRTGSLNCCCFWRRIPMWCSPESGCLRRYGAMTMWVRVQPSRFTSTGSAKRSKMFRQSR